MSRFIIRFLLSNGLLLFPLFQLRPCVDFPRANDVRVTNFMDNILHFNELNKFVFTTDYYGDEGDISYDSHKENIEQWYVYCKDKNVKKKDIFNFLYALPGVYVQKNRDLLLENNSFLFALRNNKKALDYLFLIKNEPGYNFKSNWDNFADDRNPYYYYSDEGLAKLDLTNVFDNLRETSTDLFLKRRYAYQSIVTHFYGSKENPKSIIPIFDAYFKNNERDWLYYSALHYVAYISSDRDELRLECIMKGSDKQARNIELLYASPEFSDWVSDETDPEKKSYLLAIQVMRNMGPCLTALKEIYQLNPNNKYFNFLLNREVNKIEDWILTPQYTSFTPYVGWDNDQVNRNFNKDFLYTSSFLDFTSTLKIDKQNNMYMVLINSYLNYILHRNGKALDILDKIQLSNDKAINIQAKTIALLIKLSEKRADKEIENEIYETIMKSPGYAFRNQFIRSASRLLFDVPEYRAKAFLLISQSSFPMNDLWNDLYYNLHDNGNIQDVYEVIKIINKQHKSLFENYISSSSSHFYNYNLDEELVEHRDFYDTIRLKELMAMKYINADELQNALAVYNTFPESYWETYYHDDPFTFSIFDGHNHTQTDKVSYTKKQFLEKLIEYKKQLKVKPNDPLLNYYVGNAYLSLTWFGKNWHMSIIHWSSGDIKHRSKIDPAFDKNYFMFARAIPYIEKAAINAKDKQLQILAKLNLAYCYSNNNKINIEDLLDPILSNYYGKVKQNCDLYIDYLNKFRHIDVNYEKMNQSPLSKFEYFDEIYR